LSVVVVALAALYLLALEQSAGVAVELLALLVLRLA
jgi:hypothetical protein